MAHADDRVRTRVEPRRANVGMAAD
jgi:hypothetical protein